MARTRFSPAKQRALNHKLRRMPRIVRAALADALRDNAEWLTEMQRQAAPEDSGNLRDSIGWRWTRNVAGRNNLSITVFAGSRQGKRGSEGNAFYARFVEFGTNPSDKRSHGVRAQPFFFPTYRMNKKRMKNRVNAAQRRAIKRFIASV